MDCRIERTQTLSVTETTPNGDYTQMTEHLLDVEQWDLSTRIKKITDTEIDTFLKDLEVRNIILFDKWTEKELQNLSTIMMAGFKRGKCSQKQVASFHMLAAAIDELGINFTCQLSFVAKGDDDKIKCHQYSFPIDNFNSTIWKEHFKKKVYDRYLYLKQFFQLTDREWKRFCELMENEPPSEQFYHFIRVPRYGNWSNIIERIRDLFSIFPTIKYWESEIFYEAVMVIPTFSMLQNFVNIKAENNSRPPIELIPLFGEIDFNDIAEIKKAGGGQFGLHLPGTNTEYLKDVDSWKNCGKLSFWLHDVYHLLRELEMKPNYSEARFHMIDLLPEEADELKDKLIDGELLFCYPLRNCPFKYRKYNEKFGEIFHTFSVEHLWRKKYKQIVLKDMVHNADTWKEKFQIEKEELNEDEREVYDKLAERERQMNAAVNRVARRIKRKRAV